MSQHNDDFEPFIINGYKFTRCIGYGTFSTAYEVFSIKYQTTFCAKSTEIRQDMLDENGDLYDHEMNALLQLDHKGVIRFFDFFVYHTFLFVILEYCPYGTLENLIKSKGKLTSREFFPLAQQIAESLSYCHSQFVAHRDIKPQNIFMNQYGMPILGDFGLAATFSPQQQDCQACGTLNFAAPEIFLSSFYDPFKADVWSLGVTFFQMITGKLPWNPEAIAEHRQAAVVMFPSYVNPLLIQLVRRMLSIIPSERPTMSQILNDRFFASQLAIKPLPTAKIITASLRRVSLGEALNDVHVGDFQPKIIHNDAIAVTARRKSALIGKKHDSVRTRALKAIISSSYSTI